MGGKKRTPRKAESRRRRSSKAEAAGPSPEWLAMREGRPVRPSGGGASELPRETGGGRVRLRVRAGQWSNAGCGCSGPWTQKGDGLYWRPVKLCPAHAGELETFVRDQGVPIPGETQRVRPDAEGAALWPLPCRACGAATHDAHCWDCIFWKVNDRTPFDRQQVNDQQGVTE